MDLQFSPKYKHGKKKQRNLQINRNLIDFKEDLQVKLLFSNQNESRIIEVRPHAERILGTNLLLLINQQG